MKKRNTTPEFAKSAKSAAASAAKRRKPVWTDPDDAPEITDEMLDRAKVVKGGKVIRRGRVPPGALARVDDDPLHAVAFANGKGATAQ